MTQRNLEKSALIDQIAALDFRLQEIAETKRQLAKQVSELDKEASRVKELRIELEAQLTAEAPPFTISDHALVRWLERHHGIDLETYRQEIATPALQRAAASGATGLKTAQGTFRIKDSVVTTFFTGKP